MALHALLFVLLPVVAQAQIVDDRGAAPFVSATIGPQLESPDRGPLLRVGTRRRVEAGVIVSGGSLFGYELALTASSTPPSDVTMVTRTLGAMGGVRVRLVPPLVGPLMVVLRGGLTVEHEHESGRAADDGFNLGPHLGVGLVWPLTGGASIGVQVVGATRIAPFVADVTFGLTLVGARF